MPGLSLKFEHWIILSILAFNVRDNSARGKNFKKLGRFVNEDILQNKLQMSSFLELMPCVVLVKLDQGKK